MKNLLLIGSCILSLGLSAQLSSTISFKIDSIITEYHSVSTTPGVSVSAYFAAEDMFGDFCQGLSHDTITVKPQMNFSIGSNTKVFTSLALLKLEEQGDCNLSDSIGTYLLNLPSTISGQITIQELLNHRSGLSDYIAAPALSAMVSDFSQTWTPQDIIDNFVDAPNSTPGSSFQYINTNYFLAGMLIEAISGESYKDALNTLIFTPSAIDGFYLMGQEPIIGEVAHAWDNGYLTGINGDITNVDYESPGSFSWSAGGYWATPRKLAEAFKKLTVDEAVVNSTSYANLINGLSTGYGAPYNQYGLGVFNSTTANLSVIFHTGSWFEQSVMMMDKTNDNLVVIAINNTEGYSNGMDYVNAAIDILKVMELNSTASLDESSLSDKPLFTSIENKQIFLKETANFCQVLDISGKLVHQVKNVEVINLSHVQNGIYFVNIDGRSLKVFIGN